MWSMKIKNKIGGQIIIFSTKCVSLVQNLWKKINNIGQVPAYAIPIILRTETHLGMPMKADIMNISLQINMTFDLCYDLEWDQGQYGVNATF